jgi:signal transduction histidine kinase
MRIGDIRADSCYSEEGGTSVKSRSLGIIFIAAVIVPSILLAVLSIRSAGREEAYMEKQMAATLDAEVTHTAGLAGAEVTRVIDELRAGLDVPAGSDFGRILTRWKSTSALVAVPFMLSPRYGILWPPADARADAEQRRFLTDNGSFLSDRTTTTVFQNIAIRYQDEILAESLRAKSKGLVSRAETSAAESGAAESQAPADGTQAAKAQAAPAPAAEAPAESAPSLALPSADKERAGRAARAGQTAARAALSAKAAPARQAAAAPKAAPAASEAPARAASAATIPEARQMALDAFAQDPAIQTRVYEEAREKGDQLNARVVAPSASQSQASASAASGFSASSPAAGAPAASSLAGAASAGEAPATMTADTLETDAPAASAMKTESMSDATAAGGAQPGVVAVRKDDDTKGAIFPGVTARRDQAAKPLPEALKPAPELKKSSPESKKSAAPAQEQPSQFVLTSQLLSQIASQGDSGLIPRFIGEKLVFLFWERQKDGRIAGCELATGAFRGRIAGVLSSTWTPVRIITLLDEYGSPLATPPDSAGRDWRRPFVAREIGESLPRWEAAAYLTRPDSISAQARSSSLVIWIMVMILFISVAGGGTMVLGSVYSEIRLAQQKATFVTNVSHELKTPLTSISLFVELLRRKRQLPPAKKEQYLSLMASETERLTRLINNVLDFSRDRGARRYSMRTVDASEVAGQIVESQRVRLESRGFILTLRPADADAPVRADPEALKQVILNLLSNAEKYSAERKEASVIVSGEPGSVLITVRDRGIGIQEKDREKVFREFYRVDDSLSSGVQGTGLGLTIARRIARDHGGDITCAPRDGGGTDFIVRLPAADGGEAPA